MNIERVPYDIGRSVLPMPWVAGLRETLRPE